MFARKLKVFSWMSEKDRKNHHFIPRFFFSLLSDPLHTHIAALTTSSWKLWKKAQNFPAQCPKMNLFLFKQFYEIFSQPKTFVCARRIQFWQPQRNCFDSRLTKTSLMSENAKSCFFLQKLIWPQSVLLDTGKVNMTNIWKTFRQKAEASSLDVGRWEIFFSWERTFLLSVRLDT